MVLGGAECSAPDGSLTPPWRFPSVLVLALFDNAGPYPAKDRPRSSGHGGATVTHRCFSPGEGEPGLSSQD